MRGAPHLEFHWRPAVRRVVHSLVEAQGSTWSREHRGAGRGRGRGGGAYDQADGGHCCILPWLLKHENGRLQRCRCWMAAEMRMAATLADTASIRCPHSACAGRAHWHAGAHQVGPSGMSTCSGVVVPMLPAPRQHHGCVWQHPIPVCTSTHVLGLRRNPAVYLPSRHARLHVGDGD